MNIVNMLADWAILPAGPGMIAFVAMYFTKTHWWRSETGRAIMYLTVALLPMLLAASLLAWLGTDYPGREWLRLVSFVGISTASWGLFITAWRVRRRAQQKEQRQ